MAEDKSSTEILPKVSVLMPIYNTPAPYLKESIESILAQTFTDYEYLILNDSPENVALDEIVSTYKDPRITYLKNKANIGLEASTNKLINKSRGKYIAIFDHDDISLPTRLEQEVDYLEKNLSIGVVSAQFRVFGTENWVSENPSNDKDIKSGLLTQSCVSHTTAMFRKSVLKEHNIQYEKAFFPAASYRIITRLALVTELHNLPDVLLEYRMDGNNTSIRYAQQRVIAREKIQKEYAAGLDIVELKEQYGFDTIAELGVSSSELDSRYYKATKGIKQLFIKSNKQSLEHEFQAAKRMFKKNKNLFIEPLGVYQGNLNYIVMKWIDGESLEKVITEGQIAREQRDSFVRDLYEIHTQLRREAIVHRDLIPRNFMVSNGKLVLIDFHYAVDYRDYQELDYVQDDIISVGSLGESFAAGIYRWDDAYSFVKLANYILNTNNTDNHPIVKKISNDIGERVIIPDGLIFKEALHRYRALIAQKDAEIAMQREKLAEKDIVILEKNQLIESMVESKSYKIGRKITSPYRLAQKTKSRRMKNKNV